ncbi:MAG: hypothetical protein MUC95_06245 [Spirochaetes bacterium]|jgi:hypothetical protein|nr:hypothetical protein [Spirochaetota bacterium]
MVLIKKIVLSTIIGLFYVYAFPFDEETNKIMPFISSKSSCIKCHDIKEINDSFNNTAIACDTLCLSCHRDMDKHHGVGMRPYKKVSAGIRLSGKNKIACITCHDLNLKRFDDRPWRSESLFEKIFSRDERYKTYYLIINNSNGELCKICH